MNDQLKKRGPQKGHGGRPVGPGKVRLSLRVLPATRDFLGDDPSAALDKIVMGIILGKK
jgi:hypothetical protein